MSDVALPRDADDAYFLVCQLTRIESCYFDPTFVPAIEMMEFDAQGCGLDLVQSTVSAAPLERQVFSLPTVLAKPPNALCELEPRGTL